MRIAILTDNHAGRATGAEHGLSYFIEFHGLNILFDTGQSDLFLRNAGIMGIDISSADYIILSHGHFDHGNGLPYLSGGKLICHPGCFTRRYRKGDLTEIGLSLSREEIAHKFSLRVSKEAVFLNPHTIFLGEIPRKTDFESVHTSFILEDGSPDFVMDDSGLGMLTEHGLFVVTGCGHAGIVNTLEHAGRITGEKRLAGVMGGFHLKENNLQTQETIKYLRMRGVKHVYPSHCTAPPAWEAFHKNFGGKQVKTGEIFEF